MGHRNNSLSGGPKLTPPPYGLCIIQYNKYWNGQFGRFGDAILLIYEAIYHNLKFKKERKNTLKIDAYQEIDPDPLAS